MIELIVGDYQIRDNDIVCSEWNPDVISKTAFNKGFRYLFFVEDVGLTKEQIKTIVKEANTDIILVASDQRVFANLRISDNMKKSFVQTDDGNPFKQTEFILKHQNRDEVFDFLQTNKVSMWMPVRIMVSNYCSLSKENRIVADTLNKHLYKSRMEMLWMMAAYEIKPESFLRFLKWNFKKKEEAA
jgi:hypothetical protein